MGRLTFAKMLKIMICSLSLSVTFAKISLNDYTLALSLTFAKTSFNLF